MGRLAFILSVLTLAGCSTPERVPISFHGQVQIPSGEALPEGYYLLLMEERRDHSTFSTYILPVAAIELDDELRFSYSGEVCGSPQLLVPGGTGVWLSREPDGNAEPIRVVIPEYGIAISMENELATLREHPPGVSC